MEISIIDFTNNIILNYFISIYVYLTILILPFFGALSLIKGR